LVIRMGYAARMAASALMLTLAQACLCTVAGQCAGIARRAPSQGAPVSAADGFHLLERPLYVLHVVRIIRADGPSYCRASGTWSCRTSPA
jgi:hypothetical protein